MSTRMKIRVVRKFQIADATIGEITSPDMTEKYASLEDVHHKEGEVMKRLLSALLLLLTFCTTAHAGWTPIPGTITGAPVYATTATLNNYILKTATANYDMAVADRLKWDGGATGLTAATGRTSLALVIGTDVQAQDSDLTALASVTSAANKVPYFTGSGAASVTDFTSNGRDFVGKASSANMKSSLSLNNVENTALSTWAGSSNLTTVGTLGQNLLVNGSSYIYGAPTARLTKQSTGTSVTFNILSSIENSTEVTATGSANYIARGLEVAINGNNSGSGGLSMQGLVAEPIVTSSSATSGISITGIQARAFRGNVNDKSSLSSTSLTGVSAFSGHQALLPQTALTNAVKSGVFTMTNLSGTITTAEAGEFNVNVGNTAGTTANVTTAYGIKTAATVGASSGSATSTLSTYYAAFLGSPVVNSKGVLTTNWGLYQESTGAKNYFGGTVGIGTTAPSTALHVAGNKFRVETAKTPSSASDTGDAGDICWDASYVYVCVATNTWKRSAIGTW